jgi:hypothetical protein
MPFNRSGNLIIDVRDAFHEIGKPHAFVQKSRRNLRDVVTNGQPCASKSQKESNCQEREAVEAK